MSDAPRVLRRRHLLLASAPLAFAACNTSRPQEGGLGRLERLTERVQRLLFDPGRLAEDPGAEAVSPSFPPYKVGADFPDAPGGWTLKVGGLVAHPLSLSVADLQKLSLAHVRCRHHCVEGWSGVAAWHGVRLRDLAALAGASGQAPYVQFRSYEKDEDDTEYSSSWDRESALHPQTLIAFGRNGEPLPTKYGGPVRVYGAVKLGYKNVKWLSEVNFLAERTGGYWEDQGYEWWAGV